MNAAETHYSPFWALWLFFVVVLVFDLDQTVKLHRTKLEVMQDYAHTLTLKPQAEAQTKWAVGMRDDLLKLAPGDPVAMQIVAELHLRPEKSGP